MSRLAVALEGKQRDACACLGALASTFVGPALPDPGVQSQNGGLKKNTTRVNAGRSQAVQRVRRMVGSQRVNMTIGNFHKKSLKLQETKTKNIEELEHVVFPLPQQNFGSNMILKRSGKLAKRIPCRN